MKTFKLFILILFFPPLSKAIDTLEVKNLQNKAFNLSYYNIDSAKIYIDSSGTLLYSYFGFDYHDIDFFENDNNPFYIIDATLKQVHVEAVILENNGDFNEALEHNFMLLKLCDVLLRVYKNNESDILSRKSMALGNIGGVFMEMGSSNKALQYYFQSNTLLSKLDHTERSKAINLSNIAGIYEQKQKIDSALIYYENAIKLCQTIQDSSLLAMNMGNQAITYMNNGQLDQSYNRFKQAISINKFLNQFHSLAYKYGNLGYLFYTTQHYDSAEVYYLKALQLSDSLQNLSLKKDQLLNYSILMDSLGRTQDAFLAFKEHIVIKDSIFNEENIRQQTLTEAQYNFEKKQFIERTEAEKERALLLEEQKRQRITLLFIIGGLLLLLLLGLVIYRFQRLKSQKQRTEVENRKLEIEYRLLRSQMNPHFLFNALNTINTYIINEKNLQASDALLKFSSLVRKLLKQSTLKTIELSEELAIVKQYIEIEQIRFSNKFEYTIELSDSIDPESIRIPGMLIQPFVENAILHGLSSLESRKGQLKIVIKKAENCLVVTIEDNGVGRIESAKNKTTQHESLSMKLIEERLSLISDHKKKVVINDLDHGTRVELTVPFISTF